MSARNIPLAESAMKDQLSGMDARLRRIERRREWRGVVLREQNEVNAFQTPLVTSDPVEVVRLDIPAGRWVVHGQGSQRIDMIGVPFIPDLWPSVSLILEWNSGSADTLQVIALNPGVSGAANQIVVLSDSPQTDTVATLSVYTPDLPTTGFFDWYLYGFAIQAFPG